MFKINIFKNNNVAYTSIKETKLEINNWLSRHIVNNTFGLPDRWVSFYEFNEFYELIQHTPQEGYTDQRDKFLSIQIHDNEELTDFTITEYFYPSEYVVGSIENISDSLIFQNGVQERKRKIQFGTEVIALMAYRTSLRSLTDEQSASLLSTYDLIIKLLNVGDLIPAKSMIQSVSPDGIIVTQEDIDALVAKIDEY